MSRAAWFEEYACGCMSVAVARKRDLVGYCGRHGDGRRNVYRDTGKGAVHVQRIAPLGYAPRPPREGGTTP